MRNVRYPAFCGLLFVISTAQLQAQRVPASGQSNSRSLRSATRAHGLVIDAARAMGGESALRELAGILRTFTSNRSDEAQGARPGTFASHWDRIGEAPPTSIRAEVTSIRDLRAGRAVEYQRYDIFGGQRVDQRNVVNATEGFSVFYDYVHRGVRPMRAAALPRARALLFRRYPESVILTALNRVDALRYEGKARWEGRVQDAVSLADVDGTQLTLYFDSTSHLLTKVETLGEDGVLGDIATDIVYEDYRAVGQLRLPFRVVERRNGVVLDDARMKDIVLNPQLSDTLFTRPAGFPEIDFGKPFPNVVQLGEGVYAVMGGFNALFAIQSDHVVVLEPGGSAREAETVIAKIKEIAPGKPIRYVIATHWNHDHLAGIRPYVAEGATLVGPPSVQGVAQRAVNASRALHPDGLSRNPRPLKFEALGSKTRTFGAGSQSIIVHDISPSPHSDEMLVAYVPALKLLFEADLFDIPVPGAVGTGGEDTEDLARKIERLGLDVQRILPVHGQLGTMDDLRQSLSRRAARAGKQ